MNGYLIESRFSKQPRMFPDDNLTSENVVALARSQYESLHDLPISAADERERHYRDNIAQSQSLCTLKAAMNEWCAVWFWPTDEESISHVPTPLTFHKPHAKKDSIIRRLATEVKFFHWELEFADVFTSDRNGFDGMLGNPPWGLLEKKTLTFFSDFDPLFRTYIPSKARAVVTSLTQDAHIAESWQHYCEQFEAFNTFVRGRQTAFKTSIGNSPDIRAAERERHSRLHESETATPHRKLFSLLGTGKLDFFKIFTEIFVRLRSSSGRYGFILPSGFYADKGAEEVRKHILENTSCEWLYGFINSREIFSIDRTLKFAAVIGGGAATTSIIQSAFLRADLSDWDSPSCHTLPYTRMQVSEFSPNSHSFVEIRSERELAMLRIIYSNSTPLGAIHEHIGRVSYQQGDFNMNSRQFQRTDELVKKGYHPDPFAEWKGVDGSAVPFLIGKNFELFDFSAFQWESGKGRSAKWRRVSTDHKVVIPAYLMDQENWSPDYRTLRVFVRRGTNVLNARSIVVSLTPNWPCGHVVVTLTPERRDVTTSLLLGCVIGSFCFDWAFRMRLTGRDVSEFILLELPLPSRIPDRTLSQITVSCLRISGIHRIFAPQWAILKEVLSSIAPNREWKHWWAVTEADRLRLRCENEALCADLYGLDPDNFEWMLRDDRKDPKGFWRVDKNLPYEERLTGLSARAFRALKEGKWSAETVGQLSNDEFFDILGIPELTNAKAAQAKGLPGPLILKRDGCHSWQPENFPKDDPRHGWTWDDCRNDAITLLGSEEALEEYIAQATANDEEADDEDEEPDPSHPGPKDLFGNRIPTDLFGNELRTKKKRRGK